MKHFTPHVFAASMALVAGCKEDAAPIPYTEGLQGVWGEIFAPYGLYPLFPVRTKVQPGDIFVLCKRATSGLSGVRSAEPSDSTPPTLPGYEWVDVGWLEGVQAAMKEYATSRMAYHSFVNGAATSASAPMTPASGSAPYAVGAEGTTIGFASFPSVLSYSKKRSDFGVGTVAGVAAIGAGSSTASEGFYMLEVPSAEFAHMPHSSLQSALAVTAANLPPRTKASLASAVASFTSERCLTGSLAVVGDVYYTRHLSVTMADSYAAAISARAAYQLPSDSTRAAVSQAIGAYAYGASAPAGPASSAFPSENARFAQLMIDIDRIYRAADDNSRPGFTGVKVGFARSGGKGISMDYQYAQPVAFGVRLFPITLTMTGTDVALDPSLPIGGSLLQETTSDAGAIPLSGKFKPKVASPASAPAK